MGVIKKVIFWALFLKFDIMVNHHAKVYFYNEKRRFLHNYANDHFFCFFIIYIYDCSFLQYRKVNHQILKSFFSKKKLIFF